MTTEAAIRVKFRALASRLDEHTRRIWAATEAGSIGYGGISLVARATGISRRAILVGRREIKEGNILPEGRVRRAGGGRKSAVHRFNDLQPNLPQAWPLLPRELVDVLLKPPDDPRKFDGVSAENGVIVDRNLFDSKKNQTIVV